MADTFDEDDMVVICAPTHKLGKKKKLKLKELSNENFISFEPDTPTRKAIDRALKLHSVIFRQQQEFDNIETVKRAVEVAGVLSIVPRRTVDKEVAAGTLSAIKIEDADLKRPLAILRKQSRITTPTMREFMRVMQGGK
jgi:DNA-binding transcriptional LysR family regulator